MSYAGPADSSPSSRGTIPARPDLSRAAHKAREARWAQLAVFGTGLALGIAVGAAAALLAAPQSGAATRRDLRLGAGRLRTSARHRSRDAWEDIRREVRGLKRTLQKKRMRREVERDLQRELDAESSREAVFASR